MNFYPHQVSDNNIFRLKTLHITLANCLLVKYGVLVFVLGYL